MTDRPVPAPDLRDQRAAALERLPERIAFLGFGLIGGSVAMALRAAGSTSELIAWTPSAAGATEGVRRGIINRAADTPEEAIEGAGLLVLGAPPLEIIALLERLGGSLRRRLEETATVTDVGSTKARIGAAADEAGLRFVGGHPMAGREVTGVAGATADLFVDRPWVIVPGRLATDDDVARVEALATATRARPIRLAAEEHDAAVAAISHLPLVVAAALVESVAATQAGNATWPLARRLAATGWSDMTRLAKGDPHMGAGIVATNADALAARLVALRDVLQAWIDRIDAAGAKPDVIRDELARARRTLEEQP